MSYRLGIDLGTTYTAAATLAEGHSRMVTLGLRAPEMPSVVAVRDDGELLFGEAAERRALTEPERVVREFKRRVGDTTPIILAGSPYSTELLTARLLNHVVDVVTGAEGGTPASVVVTHPANWGPFRLELFQQALEMASLSNAGILSEPEAAAVFYGSQTRVEPGSVVAVYDLGGGTFDAAVLAKHEGGFAMIGESKGIERLGGVDFDAAVMTHVLRSLDLDVSTLDDDPATRAAMVRLRAECVTAKEVLSADTATSISVQLPPHNTEVRLTRAELEEMVRPSLAASVETLEATIESAGVGVTEIDAVLLVGGSSRIPLVAQVIGAALGRPVQVDAHPKHSVAIGAAMWDGPDESSVSGESAHASTGRLASPTPAELSPPPPPPPRPGPSTSPDLPMAPSAPRPHEVANTDPPARELVPEAPSLPPDGPDPISRGDGAGDEPRRGWVAAVVVLTIAVGGTAAVVGLTLRDDPSSPASISEPSSPESSSEPSSPASSSEPSGPVEDDDGGATANSVTAKEPTTDTSTPTTSLPSPSWGSAAVLVSDVDPALVEAWLAADNRSACSALHLDDDSAGGATGGEARSAEALDGWGLIWDLPDQPRAFGVSGVGSPNQVNDPALMPNERSWSDGSIAGYGPDGPEFHAELVIPGEDCYYAVWSSLSLEHLEYMLDNLYEVEGMSGGDPSWGLPPLEADEVPPVMAEVWNVAENRDTCAALYPTDLGVEDATARSRELGGWSVSWVLPGGEVAAFGVGGTTLEGAQQDLDTFDDRIDWTDGSAAGYSPVGGDRAPDQFLAWLVVPSQHCLYTVWTDLGGDHVVHLLSHLRRVDGLSADSAGA